MSTHCVPVIQIEKIETHPNADALGIVHVGGYSVCVKLGDFKPGDLAVFVPPDYVVNSKDPIFDFLGDERRIKVKKLRGVMSHGLLVPAPEGMKPGDDVMQHWNITRYEPPVKMNHGNNERYGPAAPSYKYDVESIRNPKFCELIKEGELVVYTEKLNGCNARFTFSAGPMGSEPRMWAGSRNYWKVPGGNDPWNTTLRAYPEIEEWCRMHPDLILYGEIIGLVDGMRYGLSNGKTMFRAFDILRKGEWVSWQESQELLADGNLDPRPQWVPVLAIEPYSLKRAEEFSLMDSKLAPHLSEGVVISPVELKYDKMGNRVKLKLVSDRYLSL